MKTSAIKLFKNYAEEETRILSELPYEKMQYAFDVIAGAIISGKRIFIIGNGGSAANASHFAMELGKNVHPYGSVRVSSLTDNIIWMSAIANDDSFDSVFLHPLKNLASKGDLLIALSTSGNTTNIVKTAYWAVDQRIAVIGVTGDNKNLLREKADVPIVIPSQDAGHIENMQQIFCHMVIDTFKEIFGYE